MRKTITAITVVACAAAHAGPAADAALGFEVVHIQIKTCRSTYELGALRAETGQVAAADAYREFLGCKAKVSKDAKAVYSKVLAAVKSSDAKKALKEHQVALMSSIEGMEPKNSELKIHYSQRTAVLDAAVESSWQRLQLEL